MSGTFTFLHSVARSHGYMLPLCHGEVMHNLLQGINVKGCFYCFDHGTVLSERGEKIHHKAAKAIENCFMATDQHFRYQTISNSYIRGLDSHYPELLFKNPIVIQVVRLVV
jgi:hypothetical protein